MIIHGDKDDHEFFHTNTKVLSHFITASLTIKFCKFLNIDSRMNYSDFAGIDMRIFLEKLFFCQIGYSDIFPAFIVINELLCYPDRPVIKKAVYPFLPYFFNLCRMRKTMQCAYIRRKYSFVCMNDIEIDRRYSNSCKVCKANGR